VKKLAIIGALIFMVGVIIFTSTLAACGWDIRKVSTVPQYQEMQYDVINDNQTISLHDENIPIKVGASSDSQIHFIYYEHEKENYDITGTTELNIEKITRYKWYDHLFNIDFQRPSFSILLPKDYHGSIVLKTSNGAITITDVTAKQMMLATSNALVSLKNVELADMIEIETSNGKIELADVKTTGKVLCGTSSNAVYLSNCSGQEIDVNTSNGKIVAISTEVNQNIALTTSNNRIDIQDLKAGGDITLSTSNGNISGDILGNMSEFSIYSKTSNGKNNLPENCVMGSKHLNVTTSNGEISILFTK
jgi:hypothetical protein